MKQKFDNFNNSFWKKIKNIIKLYHLNFLFDTIGEDYLSEEEREFLENGLGKTKLNRDKIPLLDKIFAFGKIAEKIGLENANKITKKDLDKFIQENTNKNIQEELNKIKSQAYLDILGKQYKIEKDLRQGILNEQNKKEFKISNIVDYIKEKFEDWSYLKDSISYVSECALNQGKVEEIKSKSDSEDPLVYKVPIQDEKLCPNCRKAYLNSDGTPKIFKLSELEENGTNIGKKPNAWLPTLGMMHPHCRCLLQYFEEVPNTSKNDYEFDENKNRYILKEQIVNNTERKVQRKSKVKITIGDKKFEV